MNHQCSGVKSSTVGPTALLSTDTGQACSGPDRQHLRGIVHNPPGGLGFVSSSLTSTQPASVGAPEGDLSEGCTHSRCPEHSSGYVVQEWPPRKGSGDSTQP